MLFERLSKVALARFIIIIKFQTGRGYLQNRNWKIRHSMHVCFKSTSTSSTIGQDYTTCTVAAEQRASSVPDPGEIDTRVLSVGPVRRGPGQHDT